VSDIGYQPATGEQAQAEPSGVAHASMASGRADGGLGAAGGCHHGRLQSRAAGLMRWRLLPSGPPRATSGGRRGRPSGRQLCEVDW